MLSQADDSVRVNAIPSHNTGKLLGTKVLDLMTHVSAHTQTRFVVKHDRQADGCSTVRFAASHIIEDHAEEGPIKYSVARSAMVSTAWSLMLVRIILGTDRNLPKNNAAQSVNAFVGCGVSNQIA